MKTETEWHEPACIYDSGAETGDMLTTSLSHVTASGRLQCRGQLHTPRTCCDGVLNVVIHAQSCAGVEVPALFKG